MNVMKTNRIYGTYAFLLVRDGLYWNHIVYLSEYVSVCSPFLEQSRKPLLRLAWRQVATYNIIIRNKLLWHHLFFIVCHILLSLFIIKMNYVRTTGTSGQLYDIILSDDKASTALVIVRTVICYLLDHDK
jgi:hypothetical protein